MLALSAHATLGLVGPAMRAPMHVGVARTTGLLMEDGGAALTLAA